jgi:peptide deformylase
MCFPWLLVRVRRHTSISLSFLDEQGAPRRWEHLGQAESELIQHEVDHLDGILATDRAEGPEGIISREAFERLREHFTALVDYTIRPVPVDPAPPAEAPRPKPEPEPCGQEVEEPGKAAETASRP